MGYGCKNVGSFYFLNAYLNKLWGVSGGRREERKEGEREGRER